MVALHSLLAFAQMPTRRQTIRKETTHYWENGRMREKLSTVTSLLNATTLDALPHITGKIDGCGKNEAPRPRSCTRLFFGLRKVPLEARPQEHSFPTLFQTQPPQPSQPSSRRFLPSRRTSRTCNYSLISARWLLYASRKSLQLYQRVMLCL